VSVEDLRPRFGARVRKLRQALKLSQEQLAERADLHWTYVSGVERGIRNPGLNIIGRLATALGTTPDALLKDDATPRPPRRAAKR
jgi:transcriptional regulator with XRE-family HTH domain